MADEGVSGISGADEDEGPNAECRVRADDDEGVALHKKQTLIHVVCAEIRRIFRANKERLE